VTAENNYRSSWDPLRLNPSSGALGADHSAGRWSRLRPLILASLRALDVKQHVNGWSRLRPMVLQSSRTLGVNDWVGRWSRLRPLILVLLAVFLVWEVVTRSLAASLADTSPKMALYLRSTDATALLNLAEHALNRDSTAGEAKPYLASPRNDGPGTLDLEGSPISKERDVAGGSITASVQGVSPRSAGADSQTNARIRSLAELTLRSDPLNASAFGVLGQLSQRTSEAKRTEALMQAAVRRSLFESTATFWMMYNSYKKGDYRASIRYANTLLRTQPAAGPPYVMPVLAKLADNKNAAVELAQLLATNPPWRYYFLRDLPQFISDARTPLQIFLSLKDTRSPPSMGELGTYLDFLIYHELYELAYYTWLQFLEPEQLSSLSNLFNGSFETAPSGAPFDWVFAGGSGVRIRIAELPRYGEHALLMVFGPGRVKFPHVAQLIMLVPGTYELKGRFRADILSQQGLQWRVICGGKDRTQIGESSTVDGTDSGWKEFAFSFTVPKTDCPVQVVKLFFGARSASEEFVSGSIWYDDLQIVRGSASKS
jgi:hypothetical protein